MSVGVLHRTELSAASFPSCLRHLVKPALQPLPPLGKPGHYIPDVLSDTRTARHADCSQELLAFHWLEKSLNV